MSYTEAVAAIEFYIIVGFTTGATLGLILMPLHWVYEVIVDIWNERKRNKQWRKIEKEER